jgi:hypothetical protein
VILIRRIYLPIIRIGKYYVWLPKTKSRGKRAAAISRASSEKYATKSFILQERVEGIAKGIFGRRYLTIPNFNHYRMPGHSGRFEAGTGDRAVSVATVAAYDMLQTALDNFGQNCKIKKGEMGENI